MKNCISSKAIIIYSLLILPIMIFLFWFLSNTYGKTIEYFLPYGIYLIILLYGFFIFTRNKCKNIPYISSNKYIYYGLAFIPVVATFVITFLPTVNYIKADWLLILVIYSVLNGVIEELFWRYTFNIIFKNDIIKAYILPTVIFTCWHFALLFAKEVSYHGGVLALVGGAMVMEPVNPYNGVINIIKQKNSDSSSAVVIGKVTNT